jgi:hypothetical protein
MMTLDLARAHIRELHRAADLSRRSDRHEARAARRAARAR